MAFLLVSFFMLTTTFKTEEPITITTPASHSELKIPESNIMTISVSAEGRVFFSVDGQLSREKLLQLVATHNDLAFTPEAQKNFVLLSSFGLPMKELPAFLDLPVNDRKESEQAGIPCDSLSNELKDWVIFSRMANPGLRIAINADKDTPYPKVQYVIQTLLDNRIYRFNLITELEKES